MRSILDISFQTTKTPTKLYMGIDLTTISYDVKTKLQMLKKLKARMFINRTSKVKVNNKELDEEDAQRIKQLE